MGKQKLDPILLEKLSKKLGKNPNYVREQVSRRASKAHAVSEAYLIWWANQLGLGTGAFFAKLPPHIQAQVNQLSLANRVQGTAAGRPKAPKLLTRKIARPESPLLP